MAKMQTTYDELILLCDRRDFLMKNKIRLWLVHHTSVASLSRDEFNVLEVGDRSRYLMDVVRLGPYAVEWKTNEELHDKIKLISMEIYA